MLTNNEIKLLENIEFHLGFAENEVQFEEKLKIVLSPVLEKLASSHEIVQRKAISILNHINKRMSKTVKLPWDSLVEFVLSVNFMNSAFVKNFTMMYLKKAYESLTEKDKITHLLPLIKNMELKPYHQKKFLFEIILEFLQKLGLKFADLETKEVVDGLYSLYECSRLLSCQQELLFQSQSFKAKIMDYLCKSKLAANTFPAMLHVSFDCLYSPKTDENLQKQGVKFIQWITRMVDNSRLKLIGKVLLFGLLKIIKETGIENLDNLTREQEIKTLLFKPFYGPLDLSIHSSKEDNENLKVIIIKFQEFNQLNQLDQWINDANIQEMEKILEENTNKSSHMLHCCILKYAFSIFQFASILKKIKFYFPKIVILIHEKYNQCTHHLVDNLQISQLILKDTSSAYYKESANMENLDGMSQIPHCHGIG
ncbi:ARM repeat-containing protein [Gigaspora margarita]|uniref:ARM repeat-containing protein n=1 Tax=Gigaspora margarita TaxID=4874 RepID=A0A8H3WY60_GIGMA|nr:ARM repeat-containing protein [Gigaspora margarita]